MKIKTYSSATANAFKTILQKQTIIDKLVKNSFLDELCGFKMTSFSRMNSDAWRVDKCLESLGIVVRFRAAELIYRTNLQTIHLVPALYQKFLALGGSVQNHVILGGDEVTCGTISEHAVKNAATDLTVIYGMAECSIVALWKWDRNVEHVRRFTLGEVIEGVELFVFDESGQLSDVYEDGEIYVRSKYVAQGYEGDEELTNQRFAIDMVDTELRWFRSGDRGRRLPSGEIEFRGRLDFLMNIRGNLINPLEAENLINTHFERDVLRIGARSINGESVVCYYLKSKESSKVDEILAFVSQHLPTYLMPSKVYELEGFPLTKSNKFDRRTLGSAEYPEVVGMAYDSPVGLIEKKLADIWMDVLDLEKVGREAHFFLVGGHSLKALKLVSSIKELFDVEVNIRDVFDMPRLKDLADHIVLADTSTDLKIEQTAVSEHYPLSNAQRRLWVLTQLGDGSEAYNMNGAYELTGDLDEEAFSWAIAALVERHESLRTQIKEINGEPVQVIRAFGEIDFELDHRDWSNTDKVETLLEAIQLEEANKPFDLSSAPLLRTQLIQLGDDKRVLILTLHHIVSDGWSMGVLVRDVVQLYEGYRGGKKSASDLLPPLPIHYKDYSAWQQERLVGERGEKLLGYWKGKLKDGAIQVLDIPTDNPRGGQRTFKGSSVRKIYSSELLGELKKLANQENCTLFMVLMAATKVLLRRYSNQSEITVGTGIAGRDHKDLKDQIGFYVNTLVLHDDISIKSNFIAILTQVKETMVGAYEHGEYPFDSLVEQLSSVERDMSRNPLFDVMVMMGERWTAGSGNQSEEIGLKGVDVKKIERESRIVKFDWTFTFNEFEEGLILDIEYNSDLYEEWRIDTLLKTFQVVLDQVVRAPEKKIRDYITLSEEEQNQIELWNQAETDYPKEKVIHQLFEEQVAIDPDRIALVFENQQISYSELNRRSNQLAHYLRRVHGVQAESLVAICIDRSVEMIVGIFAVLKAGGAYVPIDPEYPAARREYILEDSGAVILLVNKDNVTDRERGTIETIELNMESFSHESIQNPEWNVCSENLMYVIYTSGSTGRPKGVAVQHRNVSSLIFCMQSWSPVHGEDHFLLRTNYVFDVSVVELFGWILGKGVMHILNQQSQVDVWAIYDYLKKGEISHVNFVPAQMDLLVSTNDWEKGDLSALRHLMLAGEECSQSLCKKILKNYTGFLDNIYGPTEATVYASGHRVMGNEGNRVPIGKPIFNNSLHVNSFGSSLGAYGELLILGDNVSRGYLGHQRLTAMMFVPSSNNSNGERGYLTGDEVKYGTSGDLEYIGRLDNQVKIRGMRVELSEIENTIRAENGVEEVVVVIHGEPENKKLVAYVVLNKAQEVDGILVELRKALPMHMVPLLVELDQIPLSANGKIDRKALSIQELEHAVDEEHEAPKGELEIKLAKIWEEVLRVEKVGRKDDFFALGGNSLKLMEVVGKLHALHQINTHIKLFFESSTLQQSARVLELIITNDQKCETEHDENTEYGEI